MPTDPIVPTVVAKILRGLVVAGSVALVALFAYVVAARFAIPIELEWMGGTVLDHVERFVQGKPIYAAPTVDWIAYIYTPLYYWVSGTLARAVPVLLACRVVSLVATLGASALVWRLARRLGASHVWAIAAVGCFYGAYSLTGYWYDLERADTLCTLMVLAGTSIAIDSTGLVGAVIAGLVLGLAFYAKQQALGVALSVGVGLLVAGERRRALGFALGAAVGLVPLFAWLHTSTGGWFDFYCVKMGAAHGVDLSLFTLFFLGDLSNAFALAAATFAVLAWLVRDTWQRVEAKRYDASDKRLVVFACALGGAFVASASSRLHQGGFLNVLIVWSTFGCVAFAIAATRVEQLAQSHGMGPLAGAGLSLAALLQLAHFAYDPSEPTPSHHAEFDANLLEARVHELEKSGEVLLTGRGHVTTQRHFHIMALMDVMRGGLGIPDEIASAIRSRRYAAYILDEWPELTLEVMMGHRSELFDIVLSNYYVAERWDDRESDGIVGRHVHPTWVLKPRAQPIVGATFEQLDRRRTIEAGLAEERMRQRQAGVPLPADAPTTEQAAATILDEKH